VLRVAVITPHGAPHSQSLCAAIAERQELVGVLHPAPAAPTRARRVRQLRNELRRLGPLEETLRLVGTSRSPLRGWDLRKDTASALADTFPGADARYEATVAPVAERVEDVNGPTAIARIEELAPDVVCCLGGPIYRAPLIGSVPLMLNFHSGVSPLYNGAETLAQAYANGHLALCGGTLMTMSATVDGGDVLGHVLPAIEPGDTPGRLFARNAAGAIEAYLAVLDHIAGGGTLVGVPQPPPFFYLRASDWTAVQGHRVRRLVARDAAAGAVREGRIAAYWDAEDRDEAARRLRDTLAPLVGL
jgi:folate-dependent phosphoribosylglycinamide formyltransferase PurN